MLSTEILHAAPAHSRAENPACGARRKASNRRPGSRKLKRELEQAETKKSSLATEMHRLEPDRVRFEHERLIATRDFERFTQTVQALLQEQSDLVSALERGTQEVDQCRIAIETRTQDKIEKENILAQKQAASRELQQSVEAGGCRHSVAYPQCGVGRKKQNTHHNLENRLNLQQETIEQINFRQDQIADMTQRRSQIELALAQSEEALQSAKRNLQDLEERLQTERHSHKVISRNLLDIEESIKELRPSEACQEEKNRIQVSLAEKKLRWQHLADNVRERYDADLESFTFAGSELDGLDGRSVGRNR